MEENNSANKKNIKKGKFILLFVIVLVIITFFTWILPVYQSYTYYKSQKFANTAWRIQNQFYGMFIDRYYRNPKNSDEFLAFCDREFKNNFNYKLDKNIYTDGICIIENEINDTVLILALGKDGERNNSKLSVFPMDLTFLTYLFKQNDIIIGQFARYSICDINPKKIRIFKDSILLSFDENKNLYKLIEFKVSSFSSDFFEKSPPASDNNFSLLLKASIYKDSTVIKVICDPFIENKFDYSCLIRNLEKYFNNELKLEGRVDYFYFVININRYYFANQ